METICLIRQVVRGIRRYTSFFDWGTNFSPGSSLYFSDTVGRRSYRTNHGAYGYSPEFSDYGWKILWGVLHAERSISSLN